LIQQIIHHCITRMRTIYCLLLLIIAASCHHHWNKVHTLQLDIQGHRGCRGLMPENTIPAMYKAIDLGVNTLELDVVISKDQQVVVSHEAFMHHEMCTTPQGKPITVAEEKSFNLYQMDYDSIRKYDVGIQPHPRFPLQQKIPAVKPLLSALIDSIELYVQKTGRSVYYNIETKTSPDEDNIYHPEPEKFIALLMQLIIKKRIEQRVIIQSFDPRTLQIVHHQYPLIKTALLTEAQNAGNIEKNIRQLGFTPSIYSPDYTTVTKTMVDRCHQLKMKVIPWTVNKKSDIDFLIKLSVDGIITDYPDLLR